MPTRALLLLGLTLIATAWPGAGHAQSTTFRVSGVEDLGDKLKVTLCIQQGYQAAPLSVYINGKLPRHRNVAERFGPPVETGCPLGAVEPTPAARQAVFKEYVLKLADLESDARVGVKRGDKLYFSIKLPAQYLGGHEWGVHDGSSGSSYATDTFIDIPAAKNAAFARRFGLPGAPGGRGLRRGSFAPWRGAAVPWRAAPRMPWRPSARAR